LSPTFAREGTAVFAIRDEIISDVPARERLLDRCFGPSRFAKTCQRVRDGRLPAGGLARIVADGTKLVGTVRLWNVAAGPNRPALLLGPIAVDPSLQGSGLGSRLMHDALDRARALGHGAVLLVGDEAYYRRFGFKTDPVAALWLPGPVERERFLGLELVPGALAGAVGMVRPTGAPAPAEASEDVDLESAAWNRLAA
jgi:predicted N-acetyltransferase YhbS